MIRVQLLGCFKVARDGTAIPATAWRRRRPADLLKLVASTKMGRIGRDVAIERLWPDWDAELGANNLHRALHDLRQVIGRAVVVSDKGVLRLALDVSSDVLEFEALLVKSEPDHRAAVDHYLGDLCPDDLEAEWLSSRRAELRKKYVDAALNIAVRAHAEHRDAVTVEVLRRMLESEPTEEEGHRLLMRALVSVGRRHEALRQFEVLTRALEEALDAKPSAESRALYEKISRGELGTPLVSSSGWARLSRRFLGTRVPPPIRGQRSLCETVERALAQSSGVLLFIGEAGSGKTRLLVEAAARLEARSSALLAGAGSELGLVAPYGPFQEAFYEHAREKRGTLADNPFSTFEPTPGGAMEKDKLRLFRSVEGAIERLAGSTSVLIAVDDLQWVDESSLHLFHHLARATRRIPLFLAATVREEDVVAGGALHTLLVSLQRERLAARFLLEPLTREEAQAQMADLLGRDPDPEVVARIYSLAKGNPFFTEELTRATEEGGVALADHVLDAVRARVDRLGETVVRLLRAASVIGSRVPVPLDFACKRAR